MKKTYHPKKSARKKTHGFLVRMSSSSGEEVIKRRRQKGRKRLSH